MGMPTRFPFGITTDRADKLFGACPLPDPLKLFVVRFDFVNSTEIDGTDVWTITKVEAGSGSATYAISDANLGILAITNDNANNDCVYFQSVKEIVKPVVGKKLWFKSRFSVSSATQSYVVMGLQIRDTTPLDVTHGIFFLKNNGTTTMTFHVEKSDTASTGTVGSISANTWCEVGFYYDGVSSVGYYLNDVRIGSLPTTNLPTDEELTISFGVQNGSASAVSMQVDYVEVVCER